MNTNNQTSVTENNQTSIRDFCDQNKIPYITCEIDVSSPTKTKGHPKGIIFGWNKKTYEQCMELNKVKNPTHNALFINLKKSDYWVIDVDDESRTQETFDKYGDSWVSKSISKKLPHIWRKKQPFCDGYKKNMLNVNGDKVDIICDCIYEKIDGFFSGTDNPIPSAANGNYQLKETKPVKKTLSKKNNSVSSSTSNSILGKENKEIIDNINVIYWDNYGDWLKLIWALYNSYNDLNLCVEYSRKSSKFVDSNDVKKYINQDTTKNLSFGTICYYSKLSNSDKYNKIRQKYHQLELSDFSISEVYRNLIGDNLIKHNGKLYIYQEPFWVCDKDNATVRRTMRDELLKYYSDYIISLHQILHTDITIEVKLITETKIDSISY